MPSTRILIDPRRVREPLTSGWATAQWHWLSGRRQCREGEAPAEPHPCRERFIDPRCFAKTLAIAYSADRRSAARQEPRPPGFSLACAAKQWNRRDILKSTTATTTGLLLPAAFSQPTLRASTAGATISASPAPLQIVDTNISLFRWPFRRLPLDDTQELCTTLRSLGVVRAIAGSFEGLFQRDLTGVNRRLAEECAGHAELVPAGSVNPSKPGWQLDFELCRGELGMSGVRLHPGVHGYTLEQPGFRRLLEQAVAAGMFVQVVAAVEDRRTQPDLFRTADVNLLPLADSCRGLDSLHLQVLNARPATALAVRLCEVPGLCFDTARIEGTDGIPRLVQSLPAGRVVFGSHAPFLIPEAALIRVHEAGLLTENQLRSIYESGLDCLRGSAP